MATVKKKRKKMVADTTRSPRLKTAGEVCAAEIVA